MEWVDKPLEEVDDVEGSSQTLNFVESDGLSRVRVCHVCFTSFVLPKRVLSGKVGQGGEFSVWVSVFLR